VKQYSVNRFVYTDIPLSRLLYFWLVLAACFLQCTTNGIAAKDVTDIPLPPRIHPDYSSITVPPNIAPLNFRILENGAAFGVRIFSTRGDTISIFDKKGVIRIPEKAWHRLLNANRGQQLTVNVYRKDHDGKWGRFQEVQNRIANEEIDGFLVYRLIDPLYKLWDEMGIYQRDLGSFRESAILENKTLVNTSPDKFGKPVGTSCLNCHTFFDKSPDRMILHTRGGAGTGMLLVNNGSIEKIDTKTMFNTSPGAYTAWHPGGTLLAMTVMSVHQFFHAVGRSRDVIDTRSDIILYDVQTNKVRSSPAIASRTRMETFPEWSPDGAFLYFCSAPQIDSAFTIYGTDSGYAKIKYSLMRVGYDIRSNSWGRLDTVLGPEETGLSISLPKISPDGKYLLFCMARYGNFPIHAPESDLFLMDLASRTYRRLAINSDRTESYHCWSKNGRWIVFSSKRDSSSCAHPYISYFDESAAAHKPFVLPQKDPDFYGSFFKTYNVPELVSKPLPQQWRDLTTAAQGKKGMRKAVFDGTIPIDGKTHPTPNAKNLTSEPY
jgi:hypothetical protein